MADYMICTTPRVGSQLLGQWLAATERAGSPGEFFEPTVMGAGLPSLGFSDLDAALRRIDDYVAALRARHATPNGVFGLKAHAFQFERAAARGFGIARHLRGARLIHLTRRDRLAQAVSFDRALQTRAWNHFQAAVAEPVYDRRRIDEWLALIGRWEVYWQGVFGAAGAPVLPLAYEALVADRTAALDRVVRFLGLDVPPARLAALPTWFEKQGDGINRAWIDRYRHGG